MRGNMISVISNLVRLVFKLCHCVI